jgi:hypothetical protein
MGGGSRECTMEQDAAPGTRQRVEAGYPAVSGSDARTMDQDERLRALHDRATRGLPLSPSEEAALGAWYREHDRLDDGALEGTGSDGRLTAVREQLAAALAGLSVAGERVRALAEKNEALRRENDALKRLLGPMLTQPRG